jgi:hypothetical protein
LIGVPVRRWSFVDLQALSSAIASPRTGISGLFFIFLKLITGTMKFNPIPLLTALLLAGFCLTASAQEKIAADDSRLRLQLRSGSFTPSKNITADKVSDFNRKGKPVNGTKFIIIQFESIPTDAQRIQLKQAGIELLEYIPNNAYTASVKGNLSASFLTQLNARAVVDLAPEQKMQPELANGSIPSYAIKASGTVDVWISFSRNFSVETVTKELTAGNFDMIPTAYESYRVIGVRVSTARLSELAAFPFIEYVEVAPKGDQLLNNRSIAFDRANVLRSAIPGGRNLQGEGVVLGVGDDANPLRHIDFTGRLINRAAIAGGAHGLHVMGTAAGAGIIDEKYTGHAPKATIVAQKTSNILAYASTYVNDYGMVVTNNSYGNTSGICPLFGYYDILARIVDQQAFEMPNLQHVFAAGNSGGASCSPYPQGFSTVMEGFQAAKNIIAVGNATEAFGINASSSKGPVRDGRIKPEVVAFGTNVISAWVPDIYISNGGTSMASPAVAGGLVLLYQRYRQLHSGANPRNALMKALVCNGATDIGNTGPDFSSGFGYLNLLRSVKMMENNNYFYDSVNAGATKTHTLSVPSGIAQLKIMLYWNDSAATALASHTLVNDLDLEVTNPSAGLHLPYRLDTLPANVNNVATTGADHINNIEQVVINNPAAGTWSFAVKGTTIPFAPRHAYYLVYDTIPVSATLTYPVGGERLKGGSAVLKNGDSVFISWDAYGNPASTFTLQYSIDNGATWINDTTVSANVRTRKWFVPDVATDQARVKLIWNGTGIESISQPFTILGIPTMTTSQCEGYISLSWSAVTGATDYEVMILRGDDMVSLATTGATSYTISGLSRDTAYYVAVRARINGNPGRRCPAPALGITPNGATCSGTLSDNDLKMDAIISPANSGRRLTSTEFSNAVSVTIRIKNLDDVATSVNIPVSYKIGSNPTVNETIIAPNIAGGATYNYTFTTTADLSAIGTYDFVVRVSYPGDLVTQNDTIAKSFKQLDNAFIDLNAADFLDNIESAPEQSWLTSKVGLDGLDRYDFVANTSFGRIRTFINTGIAYSGTKALTLDAERYHPTGTGDSLKATFNLQGFSSATDDIRLDFFFKHHNQLSNAANKVWVRGNDQSPWIEIYDLDDNQPDAGEFLRTPSLEISDVLAANAQTFSSSFQVRWGQFGLYLTADNFSESGYTFDDIHVYAVQDDIQMISIDTPIVSSCNLSNATPIRITIRNSDNSTITNVPVKFQIDGNTPVADVIPSIAANATITYTFTPTADLSAFGTHTIRVWADLATDTYRVNDTAEVVIENAPLISSFPYLQNFESGTGYWHTTGQNNSWEYGTPASPKINTAASGSKAWKTSLNGSYNNNELSYLYSPCFDISGLANPRLSLSIALDLEDCGAGGLCDGAYVEYSSNGTTWTRLGTTGSGTNWYNRNYSGNQLWSVQNYTRWHVATTALPAGLTTLRLRFVMLSDPFISFEGIGIDDIHIYDSVYGIYNGPPFTSAVVNQPAVNGTSWVDFVSGTRLIASVNPNGQNLGSTDVQAYIHTGSVRINTVQYYHNRNITIKPATVNLADSATVRFYFLDSETEALINATGCAYCSKPRSAYELGVSKYSDANDAFENGSLTDNNGGNWLFINAAKAVKVPFDRGYYAEFKVKDFSEFWLNNGGPNGNQTLPAELISFTATKKTNRDVLTEWVTASENNVSRYEIEVSRSNEEYRQNQFVKIGEIAGNGNTATEQHYQFTDLESGKTGVRYYRLKIVDQDGRFTYSLIRPVVFEDDVKWEIYPNPSSGIFNLVYQVNAGELVNMKVYDANGKQVVQSKLPATGFLQKTEIDLSRSRFAAGIYMLEVRTGEKAHVFKLIKK